MIIDGDEFAFIDELCFEILVDGPLYKLIENNSSKEVEFSAIMSKLRDKIADSLQKTLEEILGEGRVLVD